ncbi:unnamed protein product, partial [Nesidiocoris tenuis]
RIRCSVMHRWTVILNVRKTCILPAGWLSEAIGVDSAKPCEEHHQLTKCSCRAYLGQKREDSTNLKTQDMIPNQGANEGPILNTKTQEGHPADCVVWNEKTDELVAFSNQQTLEKPTIRLHDHAARLPIFLWLHVDVKTTEGTLGNRNTLSRRLDAIKCDDSKNNNLTLSSIFEYKDLELDLGKVEAKFLFFIETVAKIHLRIDGNSFRVSISKKDNTVCSLNWLDVQELQDYDVHVESNNWWNVFQFIGTGAGMSVAMSNPPMINEPSIINEPSMINEPSIINEESINDDQSIINEKVDRSLISIAARIRADGMDRMEVDGFTSQIPLSITGFSMPIDFSLQLGNGMVGDLSEFARLGNATRTSSILRTAVQYRPLTAEYAHMRLTSPISTCDGSLNFKVSAEDQYALITDPTAKYDRIMLMRIQTYD